jgi:thiol-disulfide isomerase/thioredoxin
MKRILTVIIIAALFSTVLAPSGWAKESLALGIPLNTVAGDKFRLSDFRGQVVVVNFWATWCPPCLAEIPELIQFQKEYKSQGVQVVGVDFMEKPDQERLADFIGKYGINYPIVFGTFAEIQKLARAMGGVFGLPVTKFLDRKGNIINTHVGGISIHQLKAYVHPLLKKK